MAKKKRKKNIPVLRWRIPEPTPGDAVRLPDMTEHLTELTRRFVVLRMRAGERVDLNTIFREHRRMFQQYETELAALPEYTPLSKLWTMDRIDITALDNTSLDKETTTQGLLDYLHATRPYVYTCIPCFEQGCLFLTQGRRIEFQIDRVDVDNNTLWVRLRDHVKVGDNWSLGIGCLAGITMDLKDDQIITKYTIDSEGSESFAEMYTKLSPARLHWNQSQVRMWEQIMLQNAVDQNARFAAHNASPMQSLAQMFHHAILYSNYFLSKFKPVIEREPKARASQHTPGKSAPKQANPVRTRTVGTIRFVSAAPPKQTRAKTIRTYTVSSWLTRGHTRHYKSGKTAYIKPSTHHRRALQNRQGTEGAQAVIQIKPSKGE